VEEKKKEESAYTLRGKRFTSRMSYKENSHSLAPFVPLIFFSPSPIIPGKILRYFSSSANLILWGIHIKIRVQFRLAVGGEGEGKERKRKREMRKGSENHWKFLANSRCSHATSQQPRTYKDERGRRSRRCRSRRSRRRRLPPTVRHLNSHGRGLPGGVKEAQREVCSGGGFSGPPKGILSSLMDIPPRPLCDAAHNRIIYQRERGQIVSRPRLWLTASSSSSSS